MMPAEIGYAKPEVSEYPIAGGRAFVINYHGYIDVFVVGDGETLLSELFETDFQFTWARLAAGESIPDEIVAINGSNLHAARSTIIADRDDHKFISIRRFGDDLYVKTESGRSTLSIPQSK